MKLKNDDRLVKKSQDMPLLMAHVGEDVVAWRNGMPITTEAFLHDVFAAASILPEGQFVFNFCEDRYWFLVGFSAILVRNQTNLLPPNRAPGFINEVERDYPNSCCLCDKEYTSNSMAVCQLNNQLLSDTQTYREVPLVPANHLAAIAFTSGSTGKASPHPKYWKDLVASAKIAQKRFNFGNSSNKQAIIATVPPQHMYGLETSVLNTLINGVSLYTGETFFPADIYTGVQKVPAPRILITTPIHLKACLDAKLNWPELEYVVSATAPLDRSLAERAEQTFKCPILEIYGCTEVGSLASRRTTEGDQWLLYEGYQLKHTMEGHFVSSPNLQESILLNDYIEIIDNRKFILHGRHADMINIAGKRASLGDLNIRLRDIEGVEDAVFLAPEPNNTSDTRLVAFVVAPELNAGILRRELIRRIDTTFLPRPMYFVDKLPRDGTGKLPRAALLDLLEKVRNKV